MVKFTSNIDDLKRVVNAALTSFDANIDVNLKQIVFNANKDTQSVDIAAYSYLLSFYSRIDAEVEESGIFTVGLEISDIVNVCSSRGGSTLIDTITFTEEEEKFVNVEALEYGKQDTLLSNYKEKLTWKLPKMQSQRVLKCLNFDILDVGIKDDVDEININNMKFVLDTFTPLLVKGELRQPSAYLYFSKDYIYCVNGSNVSYSVNMFGNLVDMNLNSKILSYLRALLNESTEESSLYLFYVDNKVVIKFDGYIIVYNLQSMKQFNIDQYLEERHDAFIIPMEMLLNIIERGKISDSVIAFDVTGMTLTAKNTKSAKNALIKFNTSVPILKKSCEDIKFVVDLDKLSKGILQKKGTYAILYTYIINGINRLKITDEAKTWVSDIPVEIER